MRTNLKLAGLLASAALALAACGSSSSSGGSGSSGGNTSAASYVKAVCTAATDWRNAIQTAGSKLSSGVSTKSLKTAKADYVTFVNALVSATSQAESGLKSAGSPSVSNGTTIANSLVKVFTRAKGTLGHAAAEAAALPTSSVSAFETAAKKVVSGIQSSLSGMSQVTPEHNPQLKAAAAKDPTCKSLAASG